MVSSAGALALIPGMPIIPFSSFSILAGWGASPCRACASPRSRPRLRCSTRPCRSRSPKEEPISTALAIDEIKIELGYGLLPLINDLEGRAAHRPDQGAAPQLASDFGFVMPTVRILDNMRLPSKGYVIRIKEMEAGPRRAASGQLMAMDPRGGQVELPGESTGEPTFGLPATWIDDHLREEATFRGYTIVDPPTVLTTHLTEILKENMPDLLSYAEVQKLLKDLAGPAEAAGRTDPDDDLDRQRPARAAGPAARARLDPRPADDPGGHRRGVRHTRNITNIIEQVRARLARQICDANLSDDGSLPIVTLSPEWEHTFAESLVGHGDDKQLALAPRKLQEFIVGVRETFERSKWSGDTPVLLTSPAIRPYVRSIIERFRPATVVMSQNEVHPKARIKTLGHI